MVRVELQGGRAIAGREGELLELEVEDRSLVERLREVRGATDEVVEGGNGLLVVAQAEDAIQLVAVGGVLAAEPQRPQRLGREPGDLVVLVVKPISEEGVDRRRAEHAEREDRGPAHRGVADVKRSEQGSFGVALAHLLAEDVDGGPAARLACRPSLRCLRVFLPSVLADGPVEAALEGVIRQGVEVLDQQGAVHATTSYQG